MYNPQSLGIPADGNTSGMGRMATLPPELRGWNWGAFLLNIFWGIGNNTWIALLMLVPFLNWVMPFFLGAQGSAWAWQNKRWESVAHFRQVQRRWAIAGLIIWGLTLGLGIGVPALVYRSIAHNPVHELAIAAVRTSPEATALLGTPIAGTGASGGNLSGSYDNGRFRVGFPVSGPRGAASVQAVARLTQGGWVLERVTLQPAGGGLPLVVFPRREL